MASAGVPDNISEEYYQISDFILSSFPKYRPPLDLYYLDEKVVQLIPFSRKDSRLSNEQVEELADLCKSGNLFVSRSDHPVYSKHIVKQLDLVLVDKNLKEAEIINICLEGIGIRLKDFFDQPVKNQFTLLEGDIKVLTQYIWDDKHRMRGFIRRLWQGDYSLVKHSLNTMIVGLWLLLKLKGQDISRKVFDDAAIGFALQDVGMTKIPAFILDKTKALSIDEKANIPPHVLVSAGAVRKLDFISDITQQVIMEHHERLDGSGYPQRKKDLSFAGKIGAVADSFSAMLQKRPYAEAKSKEQAARELAANTAQYDLAVSGLILASVISGELGKNKA